MEETEAEWTGERGSAKGTKEAENGGIEMETARSAGPTHETHSECRPGAPTRTETGTSGSQRARRLSEHRRTLQSGSKRCLKGSNGSKRLTHPSEHRG